LIISNQHSELLEKQFSMKTKAYIFGILWLISLSANGQQNIDSLLVEAVKHSKNSELDLAIEKVDEILSLDSNRVDIIVFAANLQAWHGDSEKALQYITNAFKLNKNYEELYDSWLNILLWSKQYNVLLETIKIAEANGYSNLYNLSQKKLLAFSALGLFSDGIDYVEQNQYLLDSLIIKDLYLQMKYQSKRNILSTFYGIDFFESNTPKPQHIAFVDYGYKFRTSIIVIRFNYANRFEKNDFQLETDYYYTFSNGNYFYSNYGIGIRNGLFPNHRAGFEYYVPYNNGFETSLGVRYLNFTNDNVFIVTGSLSKYISNSLVSIKPFYAFGSSGNSFAALANLRVFDKNPINYWNIELGFGNSPDDRFSASQANNTLWLKAYRVKIEKNILINSFTELKLATGYAFEEYMSNAFRNRYLMEIHLRYRL
jgi:YaiO family outer membrane protein